MPSFVSNSHCGASPDESSGARSDTAPRSPTSVNCTPLPELTGEPTAQRVAAAYGPDIDGTTPTRMWVVEVNGRSIGFVQDYRIRDYPEFALLTPDPDAIGLD